MKIGMTVICRKGLIVLAFAKAVLLTTSCKTDAYTTHRVNAQLMQIDTALSAVDDIEKIIKPYKESLDAQMGSALAYNPIAMSKNDTPLNTRIGNMLAGIAREQGGPIFEKRTGKKIDLVLLNHGGIRSAIPAGPVTTRTAYEVMPFENEMVIAQLKPEQMKELIDYLVQGRRAHPLDGIEITVQENEVNVLLDGKELDYSRNYNVLTNDYLLTGGDNMEFFTRAVNSTSLNYKIRNAMIDYFNKIDTLKFAADRRFTVVE